MNRGKNLKKNYIPTTKTKFFRLFRKKMLIFVESNRSYYVSEDVYGSR